MHDAHIVEITKIYSHGKTISSNHLFSHFFSKNVTFTKFFLKMSESNFSWYLSILWMFDRTKNKHHTESTDKTFSPRDHFILGSYRAADWNLSFSKLRHCSIGNNSNGLVDQSNAYWDLLISKDVSNLYNGLRSSHLLGIYPRNWKIGVFDNGVPILLNFFRA